MRTKRRNRGLGMEDSDSEEEDEEARMLGRKIMNRKRRIEEDKLEDLGAFFFALVICVLFSVVEIRCHHILMFLCTDSQEPGNQSLLRCLPKSPRRGRRFRKDRGG